MILTQIAFFVFLHALGLLIGRSLARSAPTAFLCCSGYLWGVGAYGLVAALVLAVGIPYTFGTMAALLIGLMLVLFLFCRQQRLLLSSGFARHALISIVIVACLAAVFASINISPMSTDSSGQVMMGRSLALHGGFDMTLAGWPSVDMGWFSNFGSLVPIFHSSAVLIGLEYHHALMPLLVCSLLATMFWVLRTALMAHNREHPSPTGHAMLAVLFCATSFMFAVQAFYTHNTMPSGAYLFLFIATAWLGIGKRQNGYFALAAFAISVFTLARMEAPIAAVFFMAPLMASKRVPYRQKLVCVLPFVATVIIWFARLYTLADVDYTYILTKSRNLLIMGGVIAYGLLVIGTAYRMVFRFVRFIPEILPYIMGLAVLLAWAFKPGHMSASTYSIVSNCLLTGSWGTMWIVLIGLLVFARFLPRVPSHRLLTQGCISVILLMYVLVLFKNPYRLLWSDSFNRMLTELVPVLVFYLVLRYGKAPVTMPATATPLVRKNWFNTVVPAFMCVLLFTAMGTTWKDHAKKATIMQAPACAPGYGFDVALKNTSGFVSAIERCPNTVLFDLGRCLKADFLSIKQHDPVFAFEDYAIHTSRDLSQWRLIYDSRSAGPCTMYALKGLQKNTPDAFGYSLRRARSFRFVRLTVRHAGGENRIILAGLSIWSSWPAEKSERLQEPDLWTHDRHMAASLNAFVQTGAVDWALGATVENSPVFAEGRGFEHATDGRLDGGFAAVRDPGPAEFIIDLGWEIDAEVIETEEVDPNAALTDYAWHGSNDRVHWIEIGDTRQDADPVLVNGLITRWSVPEDETIRFLRLTVRDEDPRRKLQLRRLSVLHEVSRAKLRLAAKTLLPEGTPIDKAMAARVVSSPECVPGYEFSVALRGRDDGRFVSAIEQCPSTVVIDLEETISASILKLHGHDTLRAWEDYAILLSADGQSWFEAFDTRSESHRSLIPFSETLTGYDLREAGAFRCVKLVVRSAKRDNRILLNRLSIWAEDDSDSWPSAIEVERIMP